VPAVLSFASGEENAQGMAGGVANSTRCVFKWDKMTWHLDDYRWLLCEMVRSSFQETAPRKYHREQCKTPRWWCCSVVANHRDGDESSVVVTTLGATHSLTNMQS